MLQLFFVVGCSLALLSSGLQGFETRVDAVKGLTRCPEFVQFSNNAQDRFALPFHDVFDERIDVRIIALTMHVLIEPQERHLQPEGFVEHCTGVPACMSAMNHILCHNNSFLSYDSVGKSTEGS